MRDRLEGVEGDDTADEAEGDDYRPTGSSKPLEEARPGVAPHRQTPSQRRSLQVSSGGPRRSPGRSEGECSLMLAGYFVNGDGAPVEPANRC